MLLMPDIQISERVLALDVRPARFGYVVVENGRLIEWGLRHGATPDLLRAHLIYILQLWAPDAVVIRSRKIHFGSARLEQVLAAFQEEVVRHGTRLRLLDQKGIARFFKEQGRKNKYDVAALVAERFPELVWRLPNKRRCWEPEKARMSLFDAAAVAYVYLWLMANKECQGVAA